MGEYLSHKLFMDTVLLVKVLDHQMTDYCNDAFYMLLMLDNFLTTLLDKFLKVLGDLMRQEHFASSLNSYLSNLFIW